MNENSTMGAQPVSNRGKIIMGILGGLLVVAIILAIVLPKGAKAPDTSDIATNVPADITQPMSPVTEGEFTYQFKGIDWQYETTEQGSARVPETQVAFYFDEFTRREGPAVTFTNPYRLGLYEGTCEEVTNLADANFGDMTPLAFTQCTWQGDISEIALAQDGRIIVALARRYQEGSSTPRLEQIYTIDMAEIVR